MVKRKEKMSECLTIFFYDMIVNFFVQFILKNIILAVKKGWWEKTSNTYYIRTRILVSTFLSYCSQKLTYVFRFRNCILTLLCINGYVVLIYLYNAECLVRFLEGFKERFQKCFRRVRTDGNRGKRYVVVPIFIFARK